MAEAGPSPRGSLDGLAVARHHGPEGATGVTLRVRPASRQVIVLARRGLAGALVEEAERRGLTLPGPGRASITRDLTVVTTGPGQWLAFGGGPSADLAGRLLAPLDSRCSLVRADDARTILHVTGPAARDTLAKLLTVDLHPRAFAAGHAAVTLAGSIPVALWQIDDTPRYALAVPRSFARSLWHWLVESGSEYGVRVEGEPAGSA